MVTRHIYVHKVEDIGIQVLEDGSKGLVVLLQNHEREHSRPLLAIYLSHHQSVDLLETLKIRLDELQLP